jgi:hypothetical protein
MNVFYTIGGLWQLLDLSAALVQPAWMSAGDACILHDAACSVHVNYGSRTFVSGPRMVWISPIADIVLCIPHQ